ncbi:TPA: hypothetical protein MD699_005480 [Klebsiella pneumoniae]|nr:hypothetical protein [Klebsiella pneumoniae]
MAALTNKQVFELEDIAGSLARGIKFIKSDRIGFAFLQDRPATTTSDYQTLDGKRSASMMEKSYGSDLCGLYDALRDLQEFIADHKRQR